MIHSFFIPADQSLCLTNSPTLNLIVLATVLGSFPTLTCLIDWRPQFSPRLSALQRSQRSGCLSPCTVGNPCSCAIVPPSHLQTNNSTTLVLVVFLLSDPVHHIDNFFSLSHCHVGSNPGKEFYDIHSDVFSILLR